jgi:hypothetical protein
MHLRTSIILPIVLAMLMLITGCPPSGGNGDDDDDVDNGGDGGDPIEDLGTAPSITKVRFYKCISEHPTLCLDRQNYFYVGDYYNRWIYCADPDLDIKYGYETWYQHNNDTYEYEIFSGPITRELPTQTNAEATLSLITNGIVSFPPNNYQFTYQMEDAKGNMSNTITIYITVVD